MELIGTTFPTANPVVRQLVEHGILTESTGQARNRRFAYQSYINLFSEHEPAGATP